MFIEPFLGEIPIPLDEKEGEVLKRFFQDEAGASAVEYGLLVALIAVVIVASVQLLGTNLSSVYNSVASTLGS